MGGGSLLGKISNPSLVLLTSFSAFALLVLTSSFAFFSTFSTSSAYADPNGSASAAADVVVNLTSAISIRTLDSTASSEIESLNLELTPTPSGRFVKDTTIVDVATSNATGYMLYMASDYTNPHTSTSESPVYTTDMIHSDTNVASNYSIPTITPASGTTISEAEFSMANSSYKNRWGYSLTEKNVAGTYNAIPAHSSPDTINSTVSTAVEHSYTPVTVGVNVDTNIASGVYTNELEFTAIANALPTVFTVDFNSNTDGAGGETETVTDMPVNLTVSELGSQYTFTLPSGAGNIPTKTGMVLKEWNTKPDGTGDSYQPGDEFTIIADSSLMDPGARTLYVIWTADFFSMTNMQDMYPTVCEKLYTPSNAIGTAATAITRGKDNTGSVPGAGSTQIAADFNVYKNIVTNNGAREGENQPYVAQATLYDVRDGKSYVVRKLADGNCWMTSNLALALSTGVPSIGSYDDGATFEWVPTSCGTNGECAMNNNTNSSSGYFYYSWYAATAESNMTAASEEDARGSICPKGFRLPKNYSISQSSSFGSLTDAYGITISGQNNTLNKTSQIEAFPINFNRAGRWYDGSSGSYIGTYGRYWSSTTHPPRTGEKDGIRSYYLVYAPSSTSGGPYVEPQGEQEKIMGVTVRCVAL